MATKTIHPPQEAAAQEQVLAQEQDAIAPTEAQEQNTPHTDPMEDYVELTLFFDGEAYKDDVYVSVNGENCLIKRGVPVRVRRKFVLALDMSDRQDLAARRMIDGYAQEYKDMSKRM